MRSAVRWTLVIAGWLGTGGAVGAVDAIFQSGFEGTVAVEDPLDSHWHPDPDGDGVAAPADNCTGIYNPAQTDVDLDGRGDPCDAEAPMPIAGGAVVDLAAEHVTPYGAWLTFRSPVAGGGFEAAAVWSSSAAELQTLAGLNAAIARGDRVTSSVAAPFPQRHNVEFIVDRLQPARRYYLALARIEGGAAVAGSNVLAIDTLPSPPLSVPAQGGRVLVTDARLADMLARRAGDARFQAMEAALLERLPTTSSASANYNYCPAAAVLYRVRGDAASLARARMIYADTVAYWNSTTWTTNEYRWLDAALGYCLDTLWDQLTPAEREAGVAAMLEEDEFPDNFDYRLGDTDEAIAKTRALLVDGLTACDRGLPAALNLRACAVREEGLRRWFGTHEVKTRRESGRFAKAGGSMPDGSYYGPGTFSYWAQCLVALTGSGLPPARLGPWLRHHLVVNRILPSTPMGRGYASYGDEENFEWNFANEYGSSPYETFQAVGLIIEYGLLAAAGEHEAAGWAQFHLQQHYVPVDQQPGFWWLLFDNSADAARDPAQSHPGYTLDSSFGQYYDRASWDPRAAFLTAHAGWAAVDHTHADAGHFQFYRRGRWLLAEAMGYDNRNAQAVGHNVLALALPGQDPAIDQYHYTPRNDMRTLLASREPSYSFLAMDTTGAYNSHLESGDDYARVQRALLWRRGGAVGTRDALWVYDLVDAATDAPATLPGQWQLQFPSARPQVSGTSATVAADGEGAAQGIRVDVLTPAAVLQSIAHENGGVPVANGQAVLYNHRLRVDLADVHGLRMLSLVQFADQGTALSAPALVSDADWVGGLDGVELVLFARAGVAEARTAVDATLTLPRAPAVLTIAGLQPSRSFVPTWSALGGGRYRLQLLPGTGVAADRAGVLRWTLP